MNKGRVIIVDDLNDWRTVMENIISEAGYTVSVAADRHTAMGLLHQYPFHIALLDIRLDERNEQNREGLELALDMKQFMPELAIVFLTAFASIDYYKDALRPNEHGDRLAFDLLEKRSSSEEILRKLKSALKTGCKINPLLQIMLAPEFSWQETIGGLKCLQNMEFNAAKEEVEDVLRRLFHEYEKITIRPLHQGHSGAAVLLCHAAKEDDGIMTDQVVVIKLDERENSSREAKNFELYVNGRLGGARSTSLLGFRQTARLGGIAYTLVGTQSTAFQNFAHTYRSKSSQNIKKVLENLFSNTCSSWYKSLPDKEHRQILGAEYQRWLNLSSAKITQALQNVMDANKSVLNTVGTGSIDNANFILHATGRSISNPHSVYNLPFPYNDSFCLAHGDMNEGNILVDPNGETWLIDFYHTGLSHPVRDFAMLESVVKYSLQQSIAEAELLYEWEHALLNVNVLTGEPEFLEEQRMDSELTKATCVILDIRNLLHEILPEMTMYDYQVALYFHALKAMTLSAKMNPKQRLHALICASILTDSFQEIHL